MSHFLPTSEAVAALRAAADLIEKMPDDHWFVEAQTYNLTAEELASAARLGGKWEKDTGAGGDTFVLRQGILELHASREQVCVAVPTGRTTTVKKVVTPAVTEDVEVPEVEWICEPLLSKAESVRVGYRTVRFGCPTCCDGRIDEDSPGVWFCMDCEWRSDENVVRMWVTCPTCNGGGCVNGGRDPQWDEDCPSCGGYGLVPAEEAA